MALTRIDSYLVDLDSLGGITFDDQAGVPTFKVDAVSHRVGIGTTNPTSKLDIWGPQRTNALNPAVGGLRLAFDGGSNANEFGSAIVFTQRYDSIDATQIGVGQISGVKISGGGSFGGGLAFSTSNGSSSAFAERLRITDTGNVGIGTTNPNSLLQLNGSNSRALISSTADASFLAWGQWDGVTNRIESYNRSLLLTTYTGSINLGISGTTNFTIANSGNVGIGTTNPSAKLDVRGWTNITSATVDSNWNSQLLITGNATYQPKLTLSASNGYRWSIRNDDPVGNGELKFRYEEGGSDVVTFTRTGNVGIGITNPSTKFQINLQDGFRFDVGANAYSYMRFGSATSGEGTAEIGFERTTGNIYLNRGSTGSALTTALTVDVNSRIGIGTTLPGTRLDIVNGISRVRTGGKTGSNIYLKLESTDASNTMELQFGNSTNLAWQIQAVENGVSYRSLALNPAGGSVGIGTTNPGAQLDIIGNSRILGTASLVPTFTIQAGSGVTDGYSRATLNFWDQAGTGGYTVQGLPDGGIFQVSTRATSTNTPRITLTSGGNVGIGTATPVAPTHIFRSTSGTALKLNNGAGGSGSFVDLDFDTYLTSQVGYANAVASIRVIDDGAFSGHITFRTKGASIGASQSEAVRITSSGNVGIGTTTTYTTGATTAHKVTISSSDILACGPSSSNMFYIRNQGGSGAFALQTYNGGNAGSFQLQPYGGNVGIGTTNPSTKLDVIGTVRAVNSTFAIRAVTTTSSQTSIGLTREGAPTDQRNWEILSGDGGHFVIRTINDSYNSAQDAFVVERGVSGVSIDNVRFLPGGAERLRITSSGNVGIGTTNPSKRLDVKIPDTSSGTRYVAHFGGNNHLTGYAIGIGLDPEGYGYRNKIGILAEGTSAGWSRGKLHFALNGISDTNEASIADAKMTILESGNVGIGITNPGYKLHVVGDINYTGTLHNNGVPFSPVNIQEFTTSGTWTKPSGAKMVYVEVIGGGGGGTSGIKANAVESEGGAGGAGGMALTRWIPASTLGATVSVTVGAGGAGYPGRTVAMLPEDFDSALAGEGGSSSFGTVVIALGGAGAAGPYTTGAGAGSEGGQGRALYVNTVEGVYMGNAAGGSGITGAADNGRGGYSNAEGPGGGGAGGGMRADGFQRGGGTGGGGFVAYDATNWDSPFYHGGGGIAGAGGGGAGGIGATPGDGGGGGGASRLTSGGNGAVGTFPGGGGGGGGSTHTGASSGAGGAGANGVVRVYTYF